MKQQGESLESAASTADETIEVEAGASGLKVQVSDPTWAELVAAAVLIVALWMAVLRIRRSRE